MMKLKVMIPFAVVAIALTLAFSAASPAAPHSTAPKAASMGAAESNAPAAAQEHHPEIREAIEALRRAKDHMEHAAHDFGGHKAAALRATDDAIRQLGLALKFDKD